MLVIVCSGGDGVDINDCCIVLVLGIENKLGLIDVNCGSKLTDCCGSIKIDGGNDTGRETPNKTFLIKKQAILNSFLSNLPSLVKSAKFLFLKKHKLILNHLNKIIFIYTIFVLILLVVN